MPSLKPPLDDYALPTRERMARAGEGWSVVNTDPDEHAHYVTIRIDNSPLAILATRGLSNPRRGITGEQFHAGNRYYSDAYYGGILESGTIDLTRLRVDCMGAPDISEKRLAAQTRFNRACLALAPSFQRTLSDVVLRELDLDAFFNKFQSYSRYRDRSIAALNHLRAALDQLDWHYYGGKRC